ncbi:hypothetical protein L227DRAFT_562810 [Lentinus tigrinus ALCF2SS1-6]|uniref:Uncharacterized protein n=1 Tax=Lentinus tigrinus ALCF2SS1-6 TaxID=1328759 RepID=A0A5C2SBT9_9APHY|nr:hypothetical protein L227DRAFT_562810 [Lentinus tigrinus ALCF2SS1-6]
MAASQLRDPSGKIIDIGAPKYASRESQGVWAKPGSSTLLWKIYTNQGPYTNAYNMITAADRAGLPVPAFASILGYKFRPAATGLWLDAYILQTVAQTGTFFAMSQAGKQTVWRQWLYTLNLVSDRDVLNKALAAAQAATNVGLRDPQGFLEKTRREPVVFIDIHTAAPPSAAAQQMLEQIQERMRAPAVSQ